MDFRETPAIKVPRGFRFSLGALVILGRWDLIR
jgi:hypothetical protein